MKENEALKVEEVLNLGEQFCWDIGCEIDHGYQQLKESIENTLNLYNDNDKLNVIYNKRIKYINKLEASVFHATFPIPKINTELEKYLNIYFDTFAMSHALTVEFSKSIEYGKYKYLYETRTLSIWSSSHFSEGTEGFSFSSFDHFIPLKKHIIWGKIIFHLNELEEEIYTKQEAEKDLQDMTRYMVKNETESSKTRPAKTIPKYNSKILAFNYNGIKDDKLSLVLFALIKLKAISSKTTLPQFRALVNGREVTDPLEWLATQGDLMTFVKEMIRVNELDFTSYRQLWQIAVKCFVKKGGIELFDPQKLRLSKPTIMEPKFIKAARMFK